MSTETELAVVPPFVPPPEYDTEDLVDPEKPEVGVKRRRLWQTFGSDEEILEYAAEMGADMRMGYYQDASGKVWEARSEPMVAEIMRRLEYNRSYVEHIRKPRWWPARGRRAFLDYVDFKVWQRQMLAKPSFEAVKPFLEAVMGMSVMEMAMRLRVKPESFSNRDLNDNIAKVGRVLALGGAQAPILPSGQPISPEGASVYDQMLATFTKSLPEGVAREQGIALWNRELQKAAAAMQKQIDERPPVVDSTAS